MSTLEGAKMPSLKDKILSKEEVPEVKQRKPKQKASEKPKGRKVSKPKK